MSLSPLLRSCWLFRVVAGAPSSSGLLFEVERSQRLRRRMSAQAALARQSRPSAATRAQPRRLVAVRASKEAQLQQLQQFKEEVARKLETAAQPAAAGGRPVMAASVEGETTAAGLREIDQESFYPTLEAAGDKLVVVDFFTAWCGPCKMIYPTLCAMAEEYAPAGVEFVKFECNKKNKELGMQLGIKVAPTFHLYRRGQKVADMTGAKVDQLRELIEKHK